MKTRPEPTRKLVKTHTHDAATENSVRELAECYRLIAEDNLRFAREAFPMALEIWDDSDWTPSQKAAFWREP